MNKRIEIFLHIAFWTFMLLLPFTFMRGQSMTLMQFLVIFLVPMLTMVVFYANYLWLTPHLFVAGKHRYFLFINFVLVVSLGISSHYLMVFSHELFQSMKSSPHEKMAIDEVFFILRDIINMGIFAGVATAIVLGQRWQHNEQARHEAEAARTDAELKTLRNQINPHFLLNTLNNIYALTAFDANRAQEAIQQLSKMLRHLLYDYDQPVVPLQDEVDFMQNYISLMRIRLPETVEVSAQFNIHNSQLPVAPMIFISLVENAFKHGVSPTAPSFIHIMLETTDERILCHIENSNYPKTASDHSGHGIGLQQVQRRLELAYPDNYTWQHGHSDDGKVYTSHIEVKLNN
jgi:sensor histidine kinase YesM